MIAADSVNMVAVTLYGHLGKKFGTTHMMAVETPGEAIRALCANFKEFRQAIMQHDRPGYKVMVDRDGRAADQLHVRIGKARKIKIVPVISGAGKGLGQILLGGALIAGAFFLGPELIAGFSGTAYTAAEFALSAVSNIGFSMVLGGVSSLLFSAPKTNSSSSQRPDNKPSYGFNGPANTVVQGGPVPTLHGHARIGGVIISAGTVTEDL